MSLTQRLKNRSKSMDMFATAGTIGLHMVSGPVVGCALGYGVEYVCANMGLVITPWGKLVGFLIGIGAGFLNVYEDSRRLLRKREKTVPEEATISTNDGPELPKATHKSHTELQALLKEQNSPQHSSLGDPAQKKSTE